MIYADSEYVYQIFNKSIFSHQFNEFKAFLYFQNFNNSLKIRSKPQNPIKLQRIVSPYSYKHELKVSRVGVMYSSSY